MVNKKSLKKNLKKICKSKNNGIFTKKKKKIIYKSFIKTQNNKLKLFTLTFKKNKEDKYDMYFKGDKISKNIGSYKKILSKLNKEKYKSLVEKLGLKNNELKYVVFKKKNKELKESCNKYLKKKSKSSKKKINPITQIIYPFSRPNKQQKNNSKLSNDQLDAITQSIKLQIQQQLQQELESQKQNQDQTKNKAQTSTKNTIKNTIKNTTKQKQDNEKVNELITEMEKLKNEKKKLEKSIEEYANNPEKDTKKEEELKNEVKELKKKMNESTDRVKRREKENDSLQKKLDKYKEIYSKDMESMNKKIEKEKETKNEEVEKKKEKDSELKKKEYELKKEQKERNQLEYSRNLYRQKYERELEEKKKLAEASSKSSSNPSSSSSSSSTKSTSNPSSSSSSSSTKSTNKHSSSSGPSYSRQPSYPQSYIQPPSRQPASSGPSSSKQQNNPDSGRSKQTPPSAKTRNGNPRSTKNHKGKPAYTTPPNVTPPSAKNRNVRPKASKKKERSNAGPVTSNTPKKKDPKKPKSAFVQYRYNPNFENTGYSVIDETYLENLKQNKPNKKIKIFLLFNQFNDEMENYEITLLNINGNYTLDKSYLNDTLVHTFVDNYRKFVYSKIEDANNPIKFIKKPNINEDNINVSKYMILPYAKKENDYEIKLVFEIDSYNFTIEEPKTDKYKKISMNDLFDNKIPNLLVDKETKNILNFFLKYKSKPIYSKSKSPTPKSAFVQYRYDPDLKSTGYSKLNDADLTSLNKNKIIQIFLLYNQFNEEKDDFEITLLNKNGNYTLYKSNLNEALGDDYKKIVYSKIKDEQNPIKYDNESGNTTDANNIQNYTKYTITPIAKKENDSEIKLVFKINKILSNIKEPENNEYKKIIIGELYDNDIDLNVDKETKNILNFYLNYDDETVSPTPGSPTPGSPTSVSPIPESTINYNYPITKNLKDMNKHVSNKLLSIYDTIIINTDIIGENYDPGDLEHKKIKLFSLESDDRFKDNSNHSFFNDLENNDLIQDIYDKIIEKDKQKSKNKKKLIIHNEEFKEYLSSANREEVFDFVYCKHDSLDFQKLFDLKKDNLYNSEFDNENFKFKFGFDLNFDIKNLPKYKQE